MKVQFIDIAIGATFFDPVSGADWEKVSDSSARWAESGDAADADKVEEFEFDDEVEDYS